MKYLSLGLLVVLLMISCKEGSDSGPAAEKNLDAQKAEIAAVDSLEVLKTYLPIYSQIYQFTAERTYDLTTTISIRNISMKDRLYVLEANYYDSSGKVIRALIEEPVYLEPLQTAEFVINELENEGGSGGNVIFNWAIADPRNEPLYEAIMISTYGGQGLSFTSRGIRIYD